MSAPFIKMGNYKLGISHLLLKAEGETTELYILRHIIFAKKCSVDLIL